MSFKLLGGLTLALAMIAGFAAAQTALDQQQLDQATAATSAGVDTSAVVCPPNASSADCPYGVGGLEVSSPRSPAFEAFAARQRSLIEARRQAWREAAVQQTEETLRTAR
jgi:hypothetical protein